MLKPTLHATRCWLLRVAASIFGVAIGGSAAAGALGQSCGPIIPLAEQHYRLPGGLLEAIALTESGVQGQPYPWALNIAGSPVLARDYQSAAALLRHPDGRVRRDVAIGCMQIHMQYHLASFARPEEALEPGTNVWYAAAYLDALHQQFGDWLSAVAHYHASDPVAQRDYLCRVASHLTRTNPATRRALGLADCRAAQPRRGAARPRNDQAAEDRQRLFAARQAAGIVVHAD
jgi:hypothetical protein